MILWICPPTKAINNRLSWIDSHNLCQNITCIIAAQGWERTMISMLYFIYFFCMRTVWDNHWQTHRNYKTTHFPCSTIWPLLRTRIWSAPMMVDNLDEEKNTTPNPESDNRVPHNVGVSPLFFLKVSHSVSYLCATMIVVRLAQILSSEAWTLRSVCVSSADVACWDRVR